MLRGGRASLFPGSSCVTRENAPFAAAAAILASVALGAVAQNATVKIDLANDGVGRPPADFEFARTGDGDLGRWTVVTDATAVDGLAMRHRSTDHAED